MSETLAERMDGIMEDCGFDETSFSIEDFSPFSPDQLIRFCRIIDRELFRVTMTPRISAQQIDFVNNTVVASSHLVRGELKNYKMNLPKLESLRTGAGMLPNLVRKLQDKSGHRGLREVFTNCNGRLLSTEESWQEVTDQMATGEILIDKDTGELRQPMEDYAAGIIHFIRLLSEENDGLVMDSYVFRQFSNIMEGYNTLHSLDESQVIKHDAVRDTQRQEVAISAGKIIDRFLDGSQVE